MMYKPTCPRCGGWRGQTNCSGESQIYGSELLPDLCEPCWFDEDAEIEAAGTNDLPSTLAKYKNIRRRGGS